LKRRLLYAILVMAAALLCVAAAAAEGVDTDNFSTWADGVRVYYLTERFPGFSGSDFIPAADAERPDLVKGLLDGFPEREFLPWTLQIRVAGFQEAAEGLVIGVNMAPPLFLPVKNDAESGITGFGRGLSDEYLRLTAGRTLGGLFTENNEVFFHTYRDRLFGNDEASADNGGPASSAGNVLIKLELDNAAEGNFQPVIFDYARDNSEWNAVELVKNESAYFVSWKYSDDKKTLFRYIMHDEEGKSLQELDEGFFRDKYPIKAAENGPFAVRGFIRAARAGVLGERLRDAGDIYLRLVNPDETAFAHAYPAFYKSGSPDQGLLISENRLPVELPVCFRQDSLLVLHEGSLIFCGENIRELKLPLLPEGFSYKELWSGGDDLIVTWEESNFPLTGRSGMMHIKLRDIIY
jgi:hypothetical protein